MTENYLNIKSAAKYLGCSTSTLRAFERAGKITPLRFGARRDRRYTIEMLSALLTNK